MIPEVIVLTIPGDVALIVGVIVSFLLGVWAGWELRLGLHPVEVRYVHLPTRPDPPRTMDDGHANG